MTIAIDWMPWQLALELDMDLKLSLPQNQFQDLVTFIMQGKNEEKQKKMVSSLRKLNKDEIIEKTYTVARLDAILKKIQAKRGNDLQNT